MPVAALVRTFGAERAPLETDAGGAMRRNTTATWARRTVALALIGAGLAGCSTLREPKVSYLGKASLGYYKDQAAEIAYPVGVEGDVTEVLASEEPHMVGDRRKDEIWDLTLTEALHCALTNSKIIRSRVNRAGQFGGLGLRTFSLSNPNNIPSIYDPAIQETGVLFGGRGVEAALSEFDAQFTTSLIWGRNAAYQNNAFLSGFGSQFGAQRTATVLTQETAQFQSAIGKQFATGGSVNVFHNWNYNGNNLPGSSQLFQSAYTGATGIGFRQPLLAGGGVEFTRIAGPINPNFSAIAGVNQGVLIARINNDISLADFEISVRNLMKDVEDLYWNLYFAYRQYDVAVIARNSALRSWREAQLKQEIGGVEGFRPVDEAQARDRYFETRAQVEEALNQIYLQEAELRRLMGLPPNDGRIIRPIEEPTTAKLTPDWRACLTEALMFRTELRRQKWNIKSLELQLIAANNLTRPRLDFVSQYQVNGFGDRLLSRGDDDAAGTVQGLDSAYETLLQGDQTGWNLGFEFSVPIGFRQAKTQVRNIELRLAKAREVLHAQELDVTHEVADAMQAVEFHYRNAESNFNRRVAAARGLNLFEQEYDLGTVTLDEVLRAQASLAQAEIAYYQSLVNYNQALSYLQLVKGTLLERNNVQLEEGAWTPQAYEQALRRAWHRSHAFPNPLLKDAPPPFAIPDESRQLVCPPDQTPGLLPTAPDAGDIAAPPEPAPAGSPSENSDQAAPPAATPELDGDVNAFPPLAPPPRFDAARLRPTGSNPWETEYLTLPPRAGSPGTDPFAAFAVKSAGGVQTSESASLQTVGHEKAEVVSAAKGHPYPGRANVRQVIKEDEMSATRTLPAPSVETANPFAAPTTPVAEKNPFAFEEEPFSTRKNPFAFE